MTLTDSPSAAMARVAAITAAAPDMSQVMEAICPAGLMSRPPESKVMPLPTSARWNFAPRGAQVRRSRRGDLDEPPPTARMPP